MTNSTENRAECAILAAAQAACDAAERAFIVAQTRHDQLLDTLTAHEDGDITLPKSLLAELTAQERAADKIASDAATARAAAFRRLHVLYAAPKPLTGLTLDIAA